MEDDAGGSCVLRSSPPFSFLIIFWVIPVWYCPRRGVGGCRKTQAAFIAKITQTLRGWRCYQSGRLPGGEDGKRGGEGYLGGPACSVVVLSMTASFQQPRVFTL